MIADDRDFFRQHEHAFVLDPHTKLCYCCGFAQRDASLHAVGLHREPAPLELIDNVLLQHKQAFDRLEQRVQALEQSLHRVSSAASMWRPLGG